MDLGFSRRRGQGGRVILMRAEGAFMGSFRKNDDETIQIMQKAAEVVPKACDILGISLSDSESEAEDDVDDTAGERGERSPNPEVHHHVDSEADEGPADDDSINVDNRHQEVQQEARPKPNLRARLQTPTATTGQEDALGSHVRKSRKRCASTPAVLNSDQSTPENLHPPRNKKRRFPSISLPSDSSNNGSGEYASSLGGDNNWGNLSPEEYAIRKKMMQDMETLQDQLARLADLEKTQYQLMQRYMHLTQQASARQPEQQQQEIQPVTTITTTTTTTTTNNNDSDGTNEPTTATTAFTFEMDSGNVEEIGMMDTVSNNAENEMIINQSVEQVVDMLNDTEIYTDADLNIGAEEIVVDNETLIDVGDELEVGSLI